MKGDHEVNFTCTALVHPATSIRSRRCGKAASWAVNAPTEFDSIEWEPRCGTHANAYRRHYRGQTMQLVQGSDGVEAVDVSGSMQTRPDVIAQMETARTKRAELEEAAMAKRKAESETWAEQARRQHWKDHAAMFVTERGQQERYGETVPIWRLRAVGTAYRHDSEVTVTLRDGYPPEITITGQLVQTLPAGARAMGQILVEAAGWADMYVAGKGGAPKEIA